MTFRRSAPLLPAVDGYRHIYGILVLRLLARRTTEREANWNPPPTKYKMADRRNDMEKRRLNDFGLSSACVLRHYAIGVYQSPVVVPRSESHAIDRSIDRSTDETRNRPVGRRRCRYNCSRWRINSRINGALFRRRRRSAPRISRSGSLRKRSRDWYTRHLRDDYRRISGSPSAASPRLIKVR